RKAALDETSRITRLHSAANRHSNSDAQGIAAILEAAVTFVTDGPRPDDLLRALTRALATYGRPNEVRTPCRRADLVLSDHRTRLSVSVEGDRTPSLDDFSVAVEGLPSETLPPRYAGLDMLVRCNEFPSAV